jgi:magnesium transporter
MIQLLNPGGDCLTETTLEELRDSKETATDAFWIDLLNPEPEEEQFVEKTLSVNIPSRDEMHELEASSRLFSEDGTNYLSCWLLSFESPIPINTSVAFVVTDKQFVSIRYSDHHAFRIFKNASSRLQSRRFKHSNDALVELIEAVVGQVASMLRLVEQDLNSLSVEIFAEQHTQRKQVKKLGLKRMVQRLGKQNSLIACLRESSVSLAALTSYFLEHGKGHLQPGVTARLKTVEQDIGSLRQYDAELSSEVSFLLDSTVGLINFEQNQSMKVLSVAAVLVAFI